MGFSLVYNGETVHEFDVDPRLVKTLVINGIHRIPVQFNAVELNLELEVISPSDAEFRDDEIKRSSLADEVAATEVILGPEPEEVEEVAETEETETQSEFGFVNS